MTFKKLNIIAGIVINILLAIFFVLSIYGEIGYDEGKSIMYALLLLNIFTFAINILLKKDDDNKNSSKKILLLLLVTIILSIVVVVVLLTNK
ncbi:hypothetical protein [uncultured Parvimonas sp.]|uniref:hypothetical protein n=1 Tax=uncultured Parvimonas sp. TaxID=747372 RepID=UPI0028D5AC6A|nr:hypothetical protein [uncultured Parvimonas sp.]